MYDVIVIGGGPAGMTAGLYTKRTGKSVAVLEGGALGGQISLSPKVENYPAIKEISGSDFADNLYGQLTGFDVPVEFEQVKGIEKQGNLFSVITEDKSYGCKSVIIASGCRHRRLDADCSAIKSGISYCAVCDGFFYRGKTVAVIGGGDTALQEALYLSDICEKVYLIHRRDSFRGSEALVERIKKRNKIEIVLNSVLARVKGEGAVEGLTVKDTVSGEEREISLSGIFAAIGQLPQTDPFKGFVELDKSGYIVAGEDCRTTKAGVFVAGDCRTKSVKQLTTAVGDGSVAAINACEYVDGL